MLVTNSSLKIAPKVSKSLIRANLLKISIPFFVIVFSSMFMIILSPISKSSFKIMLSPVVAFVNLKTLASPFNSISIFEK